MNNRLDLRSRFHRSAAAISLAGLLALASGGSHNCVLDASGLDGAIAEFAGDRARFLEAFPVHQELREELAAVAEIAAARIAA